MPCRRVGNSGLYVSEIGLGLWKWGDPSYDGSRVGDADGFKILDRALELGVFHWDTACSYNLGSGNSERLLGRYFASRPSTAREEVVLATKIHNPVREERVMTADFTPNQQGGSRSYIQYAVEKCLHRLKTDHIDILYLHNPVVNEDGSYRIPLDETMGAMDDLITQGKVRYLGISNHSTQQINDATEMMKQVGKDISRRITVVQNRYNLLDREEVTCKKGGSANDFLHNTEKSGLGMIPYYPLSSGLLTGRYRKGKIDSASGRIIDDKLQNQFLTESKLNKVEVLIKYAEGKKISVPQLAIAWLLAHKEIPSAIAGVSTMEQLEDNVKAVKTRLTPEDLNEIDTLLATA
ncbi:MAG: aldo/keto reductase [Opitutaceae bacterium]|nr:aldo/keto reductase [Opitutaceae bacterium]